MSCALQQVPGLARSYLGIVSRRGANLTSKFTCQPCCRKLSLNSLLMNRESGQGKGEELINGRESSSTKRHDEDPFKDKRGRSPVKRHTFRHGKDDELLKYEREYSPTKKYTSAFMTEEDGVVEEELDGRSMEEQEQTFGLLSNTFKHKYNPLGTDLIEELEEAKLGDDWLKPKVKKNTPIWYGNQMKKLIKEGKLDEAIEMLEVTMLKEAKVFPTEYNYNVLIGGCGRAGFTHKAFKLYNQMKERGLEPGNVTYTALFNACSESPWKQTDGLTRLRKLHHQLVEKSLKVNLITHHAMMKAYAKCGDLGMTFRLYRHLVDSGIRLMSKTFSFLLFACAEDREMGYLYALEVWRQMMAQGVKPDLYPYNLLLRTARDCDIGDIEIANRVLLREVHPKTEQTPLLTEGKGRGSRRQRKALGKSGKDIPLLGKKAEMVVVETFEPEEFLADDVANEEVQLPVILSHKHLHQVGEQRTAPARILKSPDAGASNAKVPSGQSSSGEATYWWDSVDDTTHSKQSVQSAASEKSSKTLSTKYESDGTEVFSKGMPISSLMPPGQGQLQPRTSTTHQVLVGAPNLLDLSADLSNIQSLARVSGPPDRLALLGGVQGLLDHMSENGVKPDVKTLSLLAEVIPAKKQEENSLMDYVKEQKLKVDVDFYNVMVLRRNRRGDLKAAKSVLSHIREKQLFPNLRTYVNLATGCGNPEEGFQILSEMEEAGVEPTCHIYGALIGASQKRRNYGYLMDILKHMEAKGVTPNERIITHLEKIAAFGQNKIAQSQRTTRPVNKSEWNKFRGFYVQWLSRMKVETPEHPWQKYYSKGDKAEIKFHETAI